MTQPRPGDIDPPVTLWCDIYRAISRFTTSRPELTSRQASDLTYRLLCATARYLIEETNYIPAYAKRNPSFGPGESMLFLAMATVDPDELIRTTNRDFPDDPFPASRLDPDAPLETLQ